MEPPSSLAEQAEKASESTLKRKRSLIDDTLCQPSTSKAKLELKPSQKRKLYQKIDKNPLKFFFLNESMTKPRKITKKTSPPPPLPIIPTETPQTTRPSSIYCTKTNPSGKLSLMHRNQQKSDPFFEDEKKNNYEPFKKQDLSYNIMDEIALEGLDGITLEAFWTRLNKVFPNFVPKKMADKIWRSICTNKQISIQILNEPREKLTVIDSKKYMNVQCGVFVEPLLAIKDIYPFAPVKDTELRGSCSTFNNRETNNGIRKFSMDKAMKLFGNRLIFVADQSLRDKAIINEETDPNIEFMENEYCLLEKIGRARHQGEMTHGQLSFSAIRTDHKSTHHNRKALTKKLLIMSQAFLVKSAKAQKNMYGGILHLTRFYRKQKTFNLIVFELIANLCRNHPKQLVELVELRRILSKMNITNDKVLKLPEFRRFFETVVYNYRQLHPNATKKEYTTRSGQMERQIRVIRMIDPAVNITAHLETKEKTALPSNNDESKGCKSMNRGYIFEVFQHILAQGTAGVTLSEINRHFKVDFYLTRMTIRKLMKKRIISTVRVNVGRQHFQRYFAQVWNVIPNFEQTTAKEYDVNEKTLKIALKGYEAIDGDDIEQMMVLSPEAEPLPVCEHFKMDLGDDEIVCGAYLTDLNLSNCDDLTIYDLVVKGRDRLLLCFSNLVFDEYENEWESYVMKKTKDCESFEFMQNGLGKMIYDFLIYTDFDLKPDNNIIYALNEISNETKAGKLFNTKQIHKIDASYVNPHGSYASIDQIAKIYLFQALFDENHQSNATIDHLKQISDNLIEGGGNSRRKITIKRPPAIQADEEPDEIVMEKYMGPNPVLFNVNTTEKGLIIEYYYSTPPETTQISKTYDSNDSNITEQFRIRANCILDHIREVGIVREPGAFFRMIRLRELGSGITVCNKSVRSIITRLVEDGYVQVIKILLKSSDKQLSLQFFGLPGIDPTHSTIRLAIENATMKLSICPDPIPMKQASISTESPFSTANAHESIAELKRMSRHKIDPRINYKPNTKIGRVYGYSPKFVRMRVLHKFLYYIIFEMRSGERRPIDKRQVFDLCKKNKLRMSSEEVGKLPDVYRAELSWKMFIPKTNEQNADGWVLASDVMLRMPLSVFVKVVNIGYEMPDFEQKYIKHPLRQFLLLKDLPSEDIAMLLFKRKYFASIFETIRYLCHIGLAQLGPRSAKDREQSFIYLNKCASLYDTTSSRPGYHYVEEKAYKKLKFVFHTNADVALYWTEMWRICMHTPLGKRKVMDGETVTIELCSQKPEMMATLRTKALDEAHNDDLGAIPGDKKGAAGFDSALWSFLKRNWVWNAQKPQKIQRNKNLQYRMGREIKAEVKSEQNGENLRKPGFKKKFKRMIVFPKQPRSRAYYDAIDKKIMETNRATRIAWDEDEDNILRLIHIIARFLQVKKQKQLIPLTVIRDVMHRVCPKSLNKTARAIQRRIYAHLFADELSQIMVTNIDNLLNIEPIACAFSSIRNRYKENKRVTDAQLIIAFVYLISFVWKERKRVELHLLGNMASVDFFSERHIDQFEAILIVDEKKAIYNEPQTVDDIAIDTIKSVVHCSISCKRNSPGWALQLFHIYRKFDDEAIRNSVNDMKSKLFLVSNRKSEACWHLPLKFSYTYNMMRNVSYDANMANDAYRAFEAVVKSGRGDSSFGLYANELIMAANHEISCEFEIPASGVLLNPEMEDHDEVIEELAKRFQLYLVQIGKQQKTGKVKVSEEAKPLDFDAIKQQIRNMVLRVPYLLDGTLEANFKGMMEATDNALLTGFIKATIVELRNTISNRVINDFLGEMTKESDITQLLRNLTKTVFAIQSMNSTESGDLNEASLADFEREATGDWGRVEERIPVKPKQTNELEECIRRASQGDVPTLEEIKAGMMASEMVGESRNIPHITDLLVFLTEDRFPELDSDKDLDRMKEHFVMQYPKLRHFCIEEIDKFREEELIRQLQENQNGVSALVKELACENSGINEPNSALITNYVENLEFKDAYFEERLLFIDNLLDFIKTKRDLGAKAVEICGFCAGLDSFGMEVADLLKFLAKKEFLLRVGVNSFSFVHFEYGSKWLVETFALKTTEEAFVGQEKSEMKKLKSLIEERVKSSEPLRCLIQPWSRLDGSVNVELLNEWLALVLSHCMDFPGIHFLDLCQHFCYVKPVDLYYLVEVLEELNCLELSCYEEFPSGLYAERGYVREGKANCLSKFEDIFIQTSQMPGLSLGFYLHNNCMA